MAQQFELSSAGRSSARTRAQRLLADRHLPQPFGLARGVVLPASAGLRTAVGLYEVEIARYFRRLVGGRSVCYDIGAANGFYTFAMAKRAVHGHVYSFECEAQAYARLSDGLQRNPGLASRITAVDTAVGASETDGMTTLDAFIDKCGPSAAPSFLKLDVEGMEHDVLLGAEGALCTYRPSLIVETHGFEVEAACLHLLAEHRYAYIVVNAQRLWPELRPTEVNRWVVAVHRDDPKVTSIPH